MKFLLIILTIVMTIAFTYSLQFTAATLSMGRELANIDTGKGFQDAITPPWVTYFSLSILGGCLVLLGIIWWQSNWLSMLGAAGVILFGSSVAKSLLPKVTGNHYRTLIIQSMCSRYADYVRDGDAMRAEVIKQLLIKIGLDPDVMIGS